MMAIYPGGAFKPLGPQTQPALVKPRLIMLHTMGGGTLESTDREFRANGYTGLESHFGVGADGEVWQWQDTRYTADADVDANAYAWSIETEDAGHAFPSWTGSNVPAWTDAQVAAIVKLVAWLCRLGGIPAEHVPDSKPVRRGIAGHRQGINSSPPGQPGYRKPGGDVWSDATGKVCPGDRRYAQIDSVIVPGVKAALNPAPVIVRPKVKNMLLIKDPTRSGVFVTDFITKHWVRDMAELKHIQDGFAILDLPTKVYESVPGALLSSYGLIDAGGFPDGYTKPLPTDKEN